MLSVHGWSNPSIPFARKSRTTTPKGRGLATQLLDSLSSTNNINRIANVRDAEKLRRLGDDLSDVRQQDHAVIARTMSLLHPSAGSRVNPKPSKHDGGTGDASRSYRILRNSFFPDTFIYESSIASKSSLNMDISTDVAILSDYALPSLTRNDPRHSEDFDCSIAVPVLRITNVEPENLSIKPQSQPPATPFPSFHTSLPPEGPLSVPPPRPRRASVTRKNSKSPPRTSWVDSAVHSDSDDTAVEDSQPPSARGRPIVTPLLKEGSGARPRFSPERNVMMEKFEAKRTVDGGQAIEVFNSLRTVRFTDNLVCPSPIRACHRRQGWYNRRGDQLWTNEGCFVPPEQGCDYPPDLDEYPDVGTGWMNEEGVRIDMQHRLIPKQPLRSALKK